MIIGSIAFVVIAAGMLVAGVVVKDELYYYLSIVASALAALALIVGVRQLSTSRAVDDDFDARRPAGARPGPVVGRVALPRQATRDAEDPGRDGGSSATIVLPDPPDEPPGQAVTPIESARVAKLTSEVVVIDGRPRYHVAECMHLLGREFERLPVKEAVELGFTPCRACEPVTVLLAGAPRT